MATKKTTKSTKSTKTSTAANLPMSSFSEIPTPKAGAQPVTGLQKQNGKVVGYQLQGGQIIDKAAAVQLARQGGIAGVGIARRGGTEYLKSIPDGSGSNNLTNLPTC